MKKKIALFIFVSLICISTLSSFAVELLYPNYNYAFRWYDVRTTSGQNYCYLKVNDDYLSSPWTGVTSTVRSNWNNNSNDYVNAVSSSFSTSKVDYYTFGTWPSEIPDNVNAVTDVYDSNGNCLRTDGKFKSDYLIHYAQIGTNPAPEDGNGNVITVTTTLKKVVLGHELGHVLGFGHPPSSKSSIMGAYQTTITSPASYDRTELENFYAN